MAIEKRAWRIQADIPYDESDPELTIFVGPVETDEDTGVMSVRQETRNPVVIKLSELKSVQDLINHSQLVELATSQKMERKEALDTMKREAEKRAEDSEAANVERVKP